MKNIAIVGATGLVGMRLVRLLEQVRGVRLRLFAHASAGSTLELRGRSVTVEPCENIAGANLDYALFMTPAEVSARFIPALVRQGVVCIDNSAHFRLKRGVPLVVPSVNGESARGHLLIANPNCSTIQVVIPLHALLPLEPYAFTAVTYQSASGAGGEALKELTERRGYGELHALRHPLYDNLLPMIGNIREDGSTDEERKLVDESRKILALPRLKVNSFCCRVPVSVGHGVFVNVRMRKKADISDIRALLQREKDIILLDEAEGGVYPMPLTLRNTRYVGVGRVHRDPTGEGWNFFCAADNLLRGAAYNAYEILMNRLAEDSPCL